MVPVCNVHCHGISDLNDRRYFEEFALLRLIVRLRTWHRFPAGTVAAQPTSLKLLMTKYSVPDYNYRLKFCDQRGETVSTVRAQVQVTDFSFIDQSHGWASEVGPTPAIFRTSDTGQTWLRMPVKIKQGFYRIRFFDAKTRLAVQAKSENQTSFYRTTDAGRSWTKVISIDEQFLVVTSFRFIDRDQVIVVGERAPVGDYAGRREWIARLSIGSQTIRVNKNLPPQLSEESTTLGVIGDGDRNLWIVGKALVLHSKDDVRLGKTNLR